LLQDETGGEVLRSEGEFLYQADFPPEKDPVLDLLSRLQRVEPQYGGMYNMPHRQVHTCVDMSQIIWAK